jgi:hypothetical protein
MIDIVMLITDCEASFLVRGVGLTFLPGSWVTSPGLAASDWRRLAGSLPAHP